MASLGAAELLKISIAPVAKVMMLCGTGAWLTSQGLLTRDGAKQLSSVCFYAFTPALLFIKMAGAISLQHLLNWSGLLWVTWLSIIIGEYLRSGRGIYSKCRAAPSCKRPSSGLKVGFYVARITGTPEEFRGMFACSVSLANVGNLP